MQLEVVSALLSEKYKLETVVKEPSVIYMERPLKAASHTIHIEGAAQPVLGIQQDYLLHHSPAWLGVQYESRVSLGCGTRVFKTLWGYPLRAGAGLVRLERNGL